MLFTNTFLDFEKNSKMLKNGLLVDGSEPNHSLAWKEGSKVTILAPIRDDVVPDAPLPWLRLWKCLAWL